MQGVLTETTAELAAALTLAAARRIVEADDFMRAGKYEGWLPTLYVPPSCLAASFESSLSIVDTELNRANDIMLLCRFVGNLLKGQTVGIIGAGRIGTAYARMMVCFTCMAAEF